MQGFEDVLGTQQDQLAEYSFQLSQLTQNVPELKGCRTPFEVFCQIHEIKGESVTRSLLKDYLKHMNANIASIDAWVDRLLPAVVGKDSVTFNAVSEQAILSALSAGPL